MKTTLSLSSFTALCLLNGCQGASIDASGALAQVKSASATAAEANASDVLDAAPSRHRLWYQTPAANWQTQALPIGNGRLGAMVFGRVEQERFMFNEDSLWIGDERDTGSYQGFGDILVSLHPEAFGLLVHSPSHPSTGGEGAQQVLDGDPHSKWCFEHGGEEIIAVIDVRGQATALSRYQLTSANDVPQRDPSSWQLQGSDDGETWITLDQRENEPQWQQRHQSRTFELVEPAQHAHYRFVFQPSETVPHFQIADIELDIEAVDPIQVADYTRSLDIDQALHRTDYTYEGVRYHREAFSSAPAGVMVFHFQADQPGAHNGVIDLIDRHDAETQSSGQTLACGGNLAGYVYPRVERQADGYDIALDYEAQVRVLHEGGSIEARDGRIFFEDCDSLTLLVAADTNYVADRAQDWRGEHPHQQLVAQLDQAAAQGYDQLRSTHIADHRSLYRRLEIDLAENAGSLLPTDQRLEAYQQDDGDKALEALMVHYARYLMIACSRPGALPANLQGLWNESINPPWRCDYHSDVNLQMNYWFVDQTNLSECFEPYADYQNAVREVRTERTREHYGVRGWATRSENGIFGGSSYLWVPGDAAWLAQNLWDHYAYTRDLDYLRTQCYPILTELCHFWEDYLIELEDGRLVSPESVSPEHGPRAIGNSYEQQLVHDLFTNYIEASEDLGVDEDYRQTITEMRARLLGPQIGRWGQLQEWMADIDDPNNQHRHLSHLIAVYPGRQIAPSITPELAEAAQVSLNARGDSGTGWSIGWKINLWARLMDGDRAHRILQNSLVPTQTTHIVMNYAGGTYPNLLMAHPPFQIEANFGYAGGFCEMLMQSHLDEIHLLPSLPAAWPEGEIRGLKARGDIEIDLHWENGQLASATLYSDAETLPPLRIGEEAEPVDPATDPRIDWVRGPAR